MRRAGVVVASAVVYLATCAPAAAHVAPATLVELTVHRTEVVATLTVPTADLAVAAGLDLPGTGPAGPLPAATAAQVAGYLTAHTVVTSASGRWAVSVRDVAAASTEQWGTGPFAATTATAVLTPPDPADLHRFTLAYDAVVHQVVTADVLVLLRPGPADAPGTPVRALGAITLDTVTGTVPPLVVRLDGWAPAQGFTGMVGLGVAHIADGTDHQLFVLALLLPAPVAAVAGRWRTAVGVGTAVRRTTAVTLAFTAGHSVTLALGALGLPVPGRAVEVLVAASVVAAAVHAVRPWCAGREPLVAGVFGLAHGLAFASALAGMQLRGGRLVVALLGFDLGVELMQLAVVLLVLPPLVVLARRRSYARLRTVAATVTGLAATGWLLDRSGATTPLAGAAEALGPASPWLVAALWAAAAATVAAGRPASGSPHDELARQQAPHERVTP